MGAGSLCVYPLDTVCGMVLNVGMTKTKNAAKPIANLRSHSGSNWITGMVGPFQVQALAFTEGSLTYGMPAERRISKLYVAMPKTSSISGTVLYSFDRGELETNHLTDEGVAEVVAAVAGMIR
jgi:hypothetical protein